MKFHPYPKYKNSGVPWLGNVPAHWEVRRLGTILKQRNEKNNPIKTQKILSLSIARGVTLYSHEGRGGNKSKSDLSAYKIAHVGDIVLNSMNVIVGAVGLSKYTGAISPVYYALYPKTSNVEILYYSKVFSSTTFQRYLMIYGKGILIKKSDSGKFNTIRMKISPDDLKGTLLPLPLHDEQTQIVRFLDHKCALINRLIQNKRRLIELLKEQKQAIINQAVTRGLDANVKLKPSGVPWVGDIPEHWCEMPLKQALAVIRYGTSESSGDEGDYSILTMGHIRDGSVSVQHCGRLQEVSDELILRHKDLLFNRTNSQELVGKVGIFLGSYSDMISFASYLVLLRPNQRADSKFLNYLLNSQIFISFARQYSIPSLHQSNLNPTRYSRLPIILPPIFEQKKIVDQLDADVRGIAHLVEKFEKEINLIQEYRTRLISDVVTGKIDVRNIPEDRISFEEEFEANLEEDDLLAPEAEIEEEVYADD